MLLSDVHVFLLSYLKLLQQPPAKVNILSARGENGGKCFQKIANHHLKWLVSHCVASKNWCNCQLLEVKGAHLNSQIWIRMPPPPPFIFDMTFLSVWLWI